MHTIELFTDNQCDRIENEEMRMSNASVTTTKASWYDDPGGSGGQRWWSGTAWGDEVRPHPSSMVPPVQMVPAGPPARGLHIAALVCGIVGIVVGLVPILALFALGLGLVALVLGLVSWRRGKSVGIKQGRSGLIMGVIAISLSIIGYTIVANAFDNFGDSLDCIAEADTAAQVDAC